MNDQAAENFSSHPVGYEVLKNETLCGEKPTTPGYCPEVKDFYLCWPETPPGVTVNHTCPKNVGYNVEKFAFKECWSNGTWFINHNIHNDNTSMGWANYTQCLDHEAYEFNEFINKIYVVGYSISLAALIASLWIFLTFKTLRCTRIRIHVQLFVSFALNNIMWLIWYELVVPDIFLTSNNSYWCQMHHILKEYFMVANYMWMFCEALHLHLALVVVFVREEVMMRWFYGIGWGGPTLIVLNHSVIRIFRDNTEFCWMYEKTFSTWFLAVPVCLTLIASAVILSNVLRVLLTIMHPNSPNPAPLGIRRAARAAFILTPLFGIQYILIPIIPETTHPLYKFYAYFSVVITPFQGLCVSCLFCFSNQDVHQAIRGFIHRKIYRNSRWSNYHYTGAVDSAGVYVVNGNSHSHNMALLSLHRKSTTTV